MLAHKPPLIAGGGTVGDGRVCSNNDLPPKSVISNGRQVIRGLFHALRDLLLGAFYLLDFGKGHPHPPLRGPPSPILGKAKRLPCVKGAVA